MPDRAADSLTQGGYERIAGEVMELIEGRTEELGGVLLQRLRTRWAFQERAALIAAVLPDELPSLAPASAEDAEDLFPAPARALAELDLQVAVVSHPSKRGANRPNAERLALAGYVFAEAVRRASPAA